MHLEMTTIFESILTVFTDDIGIIRVAFDTENEHETEVSKNDLLDGIKLRFMVIDHEIVTKEV